MESKITNLGKVCITPAGYWDRNKAYEKLDLVQCEFDNNSYIAKDDVPIDTDISNMKYWQRIAAVNNGVLILRNIDKETNITKSYTFQQAIESIDIANRVPGSLLIFYEDKDDTKEWNSYIFNSIDTNNWTNPEYWKPIGGGVNTSIENTITEITNNITQITDNYNTLVNKVDTLVDKINKLTPPDGYNYVLTKQ